MKYHTSSGTEWSKEEIEKLKSLWAGVSSASQIAVELNKQFFNRRSRNAVIGKVHRLKLNGRASPIRRDVVEIEIVRSYVPDTQDVPECKEVGCPNIPLRGKSYCQKHSELYHIKPNPRKEPIKWNTSKLPR